MEPTSDPIGNVLKVKTKSSTKNQYSPFAQDLDFPGTQPNQNQENIQVESFRIQRDSLKRNDLTNL